MMKYTRDNIGWNAEPNAPDVRLSTAGNDVTLRFYLNCFLFDRFNEDDQAKLTFCNCRKYTLNSMNNEGYFAGHYRFTNQSLPWGEFYEIQTDLPDEPGVNFTMLNADADDQRLRHYIFFFRDNTFECLAESFALEFLT
jgi:hypothetical protein